MNVRTLKLGSILGAALLGLSLWLTPAVSYGHEPFATVTASEVQEALRFKKADDMESIIIRLANATLVGKATGGICVGSADCPIDGRAESSVNLSTGQGPFSGTFDLLMDTNPGSPLLMDLVLTGRVKVQGTLNLGPALLFLQSGGGAPVAFINGTWTSRDLHASGEIAGTFFIPIPSALLGKSCDMGWAYYNPLATPTVFFQCLKMENFSLGAPVVQLKADLTKQMRGKHHGDD